MNINDFKRKIQEKQAEITKAIHRTLPIKIGRKAADHFQDNFRKGGFAVRHPPIPVSLATPPRPMPSSPKTTPISQKTTTTAPSTNPTSNPDPAPSSRRKQKTATTVHISMDASIVKMKLNGYGTKKEISRERQSKESSFLILYLIKEYLFQVKALRNG